MIAESDLTMTAFTASPDFASGTPTTPHSRMPGIVTTTLSTSLGYTLNPDTRIMSFLQSVIANQPRASM